ncbi:MAG: hypothetical protein HC880_06455 [Bacteroidia bacterium]|nr:hypothetical protein [Bacteroidia bacterium]
MYLRARWYDPASGTFLGRDPFEGFPDMPYSQHPYQYAYSNPVLWTDPSGLTIFVQRVAADKPSSKTRQVHAHMVQTDTPLMQSAFLRGQRYAKIARQLNNAIRRDLGRSAVDKLTIGYTRINGQPYVSVNSSAGRRVVEYLNRRYPGRVI